MRSYIAAAAFAVLAQAQDLDWDLVSQLTPVPDVTIPVVYATAPATTATATTVSYDGEATAAALSSALVANPSDSAPLDSAIAKRAATTGCQAQPTGVPLGPTGDADTPSNFLAYPAFSSAAAAEAVPSAVPSGYVNTFSNLNASNNAYGYMGYTLLPEYKAQTCADKCTKINGCQAFNIYYERDPSQNPGTGCENPKSTTNIKCVFWSGPVTKDNANNAGQWRNQFQVVIAGSNGYVNQSIATPAGYNAGVYLGKATINAPLDCTGDNSFLQPQVVGNGVFDANLCAVACNQQASYARQHPPADGSFNKMCSFFNTYILYKNGTSLGQYCAMYDQTWSSSYAKNTGYYSGSDHYTIDFSYTFSNSTDGGQPRYPCNVASAKSAIVSASLQPYCSSVLSNGATQTATATNTLATVNANDKSQTTATPSALTKYPASVIASACALATSA
ncbi:unnamed protein product [Aureobasidium mustum]|uniref:Carbohydrate-binding-like protein n=1 Tax=Aureobasidium mustum TaxID=2773714 RepID=A0A9N8JMN6_9PEZI|nr:unnamed protein product [Aureobasidium mustum]